MEYDKRTLIIMGVCVVIGFICLTIGIVTSEIQIRKNQIEEFYDNIGD